MIKSSKIILVYHGIGSDNKFLEVTEDNFKKQINYLLDNGFNFFSLAEFMKSNDKAIVLVFDDGLRTLFKVKDFLENKNIPFAISLITKKLTNQDNTYLKINDLLKIKKCEFLSHGINHINLTAISDDKLIREIILSKIILEKQLNRKINCFVYPFGKYNKKVLDVVKKAKYNNALSLLPFHTDSNSNKLCLPRLNINGYIGFNKFKFFMSKMGNLYLHLSFIKRNIVGQDYLNK